MDDDAELARRAGQGDREAAGRIFDRYAPLVRAVLLDATGSRVEANDQVQEVFLKALRRIDQLRQPDRLGAWLLAIARRQGVEYRRQAARQRRRQAAYLPEVHGAAAPTDAAARHDAREAVRLALAQLSDRERLAIHLHYLGDEPAESARRILGLSPAGYYKLLAKAREHVRSLLVAMEELR